MTVTITWDESSYLNQTFEAERLHGGWIKVNTETGWCYFSSKEYEIIQ